MKSGFAIASAVVVCGIFILIVLQQPRHILGFLIFEGLFLVSVSGYWRFSRLGMVEPIREDSATRQARLLGEIFLAAVIAIEVVLIAVACLLRRTETGYAALAFGIFGGLCANLFVPFMVRRATARRREGHN